MMPYDGCHMMVFQEELRTAGDNFLKALKAENANEEQIGGQKTLVLQQKAEDDEWKHYFTLPKPNIILTATDRSYLEEVLKRMAMKEKPPDRALPENLGEWQYVDRKAKFWGIRHYDKANAKNDPSSPLTNERAAANTPDAEAVGLVFVYDPSKEKKVSIKYLSGSEQAADIAAMAWSHEQEGLKPEIRQKAKGVVEITVESDGEMTKEIFLLVFLTSLGHGIYL